MIPSAANGDFSMTSSARTSRGRTSLVAALLGAALASGCVDEKAEALQSSPQGRPGRARTARSATPERNFTCEPDAVREAEVFRAVTGAPGAALMLRPIGESCRYHLLYRSADGKENMLSLSPGLFLLGDAKRFTGSTPEEGEQTVVCASDMQHRQSSVASTEPETVNRSLESVSVLCAVERQGGWKRAIVVPGGSDWAAWVLEVGEVEQKPGVFRVVYTRDSTFQPFRFSDEGRPANDGIYETRFTLRNGDLVALETTKRSSTTVTLTVE
jgi:hypothetical protein